MKVEKESVSALVVGVGGILGLLLVVDGYKHTFGWPSPELILGLLILISVILYHNKS